MGEPFRVQIDMAAADRYVGPFQDAAERYALMHGGRIEVSDQFGVNFRIYPRTSPAKRDGCGLPAAQLWQAGVSRSESRSA